MSLPDFGRGKPYVPTLGERFMAAVRCGDAPAVERLRAELEKFGYSREAIRDLWEVFGLTAEQHNHRLRGGLERSRLAELVATWGPVEPVPELARVMATETRDG